MGKSRQFRQSSEWTEESRAFFRKDCVEFAELKRINPQNMFIKCFQVLFEKWHVKTTHSVKSARKELVSKWKRHLTLQKETGMENPTSDDISEEILMRVSGQLKPEVLDACSKLFSNHNREIILSPVAMSGVEFTERSASQLKFKIQCPSIRKTVSMGKKTKSFGKKKMQKNVRI